MNGMKLRMKQNHFIGPRYHQLTYPSGLAENHIRLIDSLHSPCLFLKLPSARLDCGHIKHGTTFLALYSAQFVFFRPFLCYVKTSSISTEFNMILIPEKHILHWFLWPLSSLMLFSLVVLSQLGVKTRPWYLQPKR